MAKLKVNPLLATDSYKVSHKGFMVDGTTTIYSNMTPRNLSRLPKTVSFDGKVVVFGGQMVVQDLKHDWDEMFFSQPKDKAIDDVMRLLGAYIGHTDREHFEALHDLGYLPIHFKSLPEGVLINAKVPMWTFVNTHPDFAWLTNYLETYISAEGWKPFTVASIIRQYRLLSNKWALLTTGSEDFAAFQVHDFCYRGMSNTLDAAKTGAGFLLSSVGTDNIPALTAIECYYNTKVDKAFIATSVPASEHSLACTGIEVDGELETYRKWITKDYPSGLVSIVSDTTDFFRVVTEYATALKDDIINRAPNELGMAKTVFRPDSGCPVKVLTGYTLDEYFVTECGETVCNQTGRVLSIPEMKGAVECLWDIFGGSTTEKGYKQLHERVGLIYGDSITLERAEAILERLEAKGFASTNVVFGVGSYTSQYLTRDSTGSAIKATLAVVDGEEVPLSKAPETDSGEKHSARGYLRVDLKDGEYVLKQNVSKKDEQGGELRTIFKDGVLYNQDDYITIRNRLWSK